jgi:dipeptidyl aminopeptidase/acylaminoacyl peptidase
MGLPGYVRTYLLQRAWVPLVAVIILSVLVLAIMASRGTSPGADNDGRVAPIATFVADQETDAMPPDTKPAGTSPQGIVTDAIDGRIAFVAAYDGDREVYTMRPDGTKVRQDTYNPASDSDPAWSPDGTRIALSRSGPFEGSEIWVKSVNGGKSIRLTHNNGAPDYAPSWSPDGNKIAFTRSRTTSGNDDNVGKHILVINADGSGGRVRLTRGPDNYESPVWSPDGTKMAFIRDYDIWVMNADGSAEKNLTDTPYEAYGEGKERFPDWSPDGTKIVFEAYRNGNTDLYTINLDDSTQANVTNTPEVNESEPVWSPKGTRIAFTERGGIVTDDVWIVNADGTNRTQLTNTLGQSESGLDWGVYAPPEKN